MLKWRGLVAGLIAAFSVLAASRGAKASSTFPPALRDALQKEFNQSFCVPQCTACHLTNNGGPGMMNVFGANLEKYGHLGPVVTGQVSTAIHTYFTAAVPADAPQTDTHEFDSDGDGVSDRMELLAGDSPSDPLPRGQGEFCTEIRYGCTGGRIAPAQPPIDRVSLIAASVVVLGFAAMRRRRRRVQRAGQGASTKVPFKRALPAMVGRPDG